MSTNDLLQIEDKVNLIKHYESIAENASAQAEEIKNSIKELMTERGLETITTPNFIIRFVNVLSSRFDTKRFKMDFGADAYAEYCKQVASKKFTISQ